MTIFPEAEEDNSIIKLYLGGDRVLYYDRTVPTLDVEWLFMIMILHLRLKYGLTNYKNKLVKFSEATGVLLNKKRFPSIETTDEYTVESVEADTTSTYKKDDRNKTALESEKFVNIKGAH